MQGYLSAERLVMNEIEKTKFEVTWLFQEEGEGVVCLGPYHHRNLLRGCQANLHV